MASEIGPSARASRMAVPQSRAIMIRSGSGRGTRPVSNSCPNDRKRLSRCEESVLGQRQVWLSCARGGVRRRSHLPELPSLGGVQRDRRASLGVSNRSDGTSRAGWQLSRFRARRRTAIRASRLCEPSAPAAVPGRRTWPATTRHRRDRRRSGRRDLVARTLPIPPRGSRLPRQGQARRWRSPDG
jgi:hypothetical protein